MSKFPEAMVCQYLDDVCAASPVGRNPGVEQFRDDYMRVAAEIGVKLAPENDPEKAFNPRQDGTVLGVHYNTVKWTWEIPSEKLARLINQIDAAVAAEWLYQEQIWSLVGRIIHYAPLISNGRFNIGHLIKANSVSKQKKFRVVMAPEAKRQLMFWREILVTTSGLASIPVTPAAVPAWAVEFYTDAAGGSWNSPGLGCGGVTKGAWFFLHWSRNVNGDACWDGKRIGGKMSALELVGPLICLAAWPTKVMNKPVKFLVDNAGSVCIWKKGYSSSCQLASTLVTAIASVAAGLGTQVHIEKVARCSDPGTVMADALSKSAFGRFREASEGWDMPDEPTPVPLAIMRWLDKPAPNDDLGLAVLKDISNDWPVLGLSVR